jgi:hypothetical protein
MAERPAREAAASTAFVTPPDVKARCGARIRTKIVPPLGGGGPNVTQVGGDCSPDIRRQGQTLAATTFALDDELAGVPVSDPSEQANGSGERLAGVGSLRHYAGNPAGVTPQRSRPRIV